MTLICFLYNNAAELEKLTKVGGENLTICGQNYCTYGPTSQLLQRLAVGMDCNTPTKGNTTAWKTYNFLTPRNKKIFPAGGICPKLHGTCQKGPSHVYTHVQ